VRAALADLDALVWVDIDADGREEAEPLLRDVFGFHPLTIDDCFNTLIDPPKVDDYGTYLFMIVHAVRYNAQTHDLWTAELDMYVGRNYVVSVHWSPLRAIDEVRRLAEGNGLVFSRGADFLAHALFDITVDDFHPVVEALDEEISTVQEQVLASPERPVLQQLMALKRNAQRLRRSILPQRDVANRFARGEYDHLVAGEALMYYRDIYDHTVRVEEMIDSVRDLSDSALNTYLSSVNNRTNEVMKTLAIVTVVFLPMTLIASVYGTNFEDTIPGYGRSWGFAVMLLSFVAIAAGLWAWFRWRKWI
jgi:magnesium transporter